MGGFCLRINYHFFVHTTKNEAAHTLLDVKGEGLLPTRIPLQVFTSLL